MLHLAGSLVSHFARVLNFSVYALGRTKLDLTPFFSPPFNHCFIALQVEECRMQLKLGVLDL